MTARKAYRMLALALCLGSIVACSRGPAELILGRWEQVDGPEFVEFFDDGTLSIGGDGGLVGGDFQLLGDGRLKVSWGPADSPIAPRFVDIDVTAETLTVTEEDGHVRSYRRGG